MKGTYYLRKKESLISSSTVLHPCEVCEQAKKSDEIPSHFGDSWSCGTKILEVCKVQWNILIYFKSFYEHDDKRRSSEIVSSNKSNISGSINCLLEWNCISKSFSSIPVKTCNYCILWVLARFLRFKDVNSYLWEKIGKLDMEWAWLVVRQCSNWLHSSVLPSSALIRQQHKNFRSFLISVLNRSKVMNSFNRYSVVNFGFLKCSESTVNQPSPQNK